MECKKIYVRSVFKDHKISSTIICEDLVQYEQISNDINKKTQKFFYIIQDIVKRYVKHYEIHLCLHIETIVNQIYFSIENIIMTIFFQRENGEWDVLQYDCGKEIYREQIEEFVSTNILNFMDYTSVFDEFDYIMLEEKDIILLFNIFLQYFYERKEVHMLDDGDVFCFVSQDGQEICFSNKIDLRKTYPVLLEKLVYIDTSRILKGNIRYVKTKKIINYSTILNFHNGDIHLLLDLNAPHKNKFLFRSNIREFFSSFYILDQNQKWILFEINK